MESAADMLETLLQASVELDRDVVLAAAMKELARRMPVCIALAVHRTEEQTLLIDRLWTPMGVEAGGGQAVSLSPVQVDTFLSWHQKGIVTSAAMVSEFVFLTGLLPLISTRTGVEDSSVVVLPLPPEGAEQRLIVLVAGCTHSYSDTDTSVCSFLCRVLGLSERLIQEHERLLRTQRHYEQERRMLRGSLTERVDLHGVGQGLAEVTALSRQLSKISQPVLLLGELGAGKSRVARLIHELSARADGMLVRLDCATIPPEPASAGDSEEWKNALLTAHGGTLFLPSIAAMPVHAQQVLLELIRTRHIEVGGTRYKADVKVIASNRTPLDALVSAGRFSVPLFHCLSVFTLTVPPLRNRRGDIPELLASMVKDKARALHLQGNLSIDPEDAHALSERSWPGNVLELEHVVVQALLQWYQAGQPDAPLVFACLEQPPA